MIKFQCDTCGYETDSYHKSKNNGEYIPLKWITLSGVTVHNEHHSPSLSYAGNATMHFCSKKCFINKFFKPEEMREQIDRWKQFLNEQQIITPKVLTLDTQQFSQLVMNTNYSDGYFKDDTIENRIEFFYITSIPDTPASIENAYFVVLLIGDKIIGIAKVDYYSKPTSIINFFSIDKEYRGNGYSRWMADALFNEAKNRNKNITTSLYTQLGKTHLQHLFNEYAKKHGVKFIDRKESDPLYQY